MENQAIKVSHLHILKLLVAVATYPSTGVQKGQNRWAKAFVSKGETECSRHQRLLEENIRKNKKMKVCGF